MQQIFDSNLFGITITLISFYIGNLVYKKWKTPLLSPFIVSIFIIISFLVILKIPTKYYTNGAYFIQLFLIPATCSIALSIYKNLEIIKKNLFPIIIGTFVGSLTSIISVSILCRIFNLEDNITNAMLPKSVTNAIAIDLAEKRNAIVPVTIISVILTGIFGAIFSPFLIKIFKIKNPIAIGIAIGTSSHGIGTSKAIEIGQLEGALSGIAMALAGIMTVFIMIFI